VRKSVIKALFIAAYVMIGPEKSECRRCFMISKVSVSVRTRLLSALFLTLPLACIAGQTASAADCPGHPDALGTSRTLVVDPKEHPRIGTMQYSETLPLEDHEVVLTFDDGPLPRNSNQILDILASECVKATFFTIGHMAQAYPEGVRKLRDADHSIGTHTQDHPLTMDHMPVERAKQEIDEGIASVKAALGDDAALAPFFRIPGLLRADGVEEYLASQGIQIWSADFLADDWRSISSARVVDLAIKRLEEKGKGILLLHDIQARTVAALPKILQELKARGYRIVHVVAATPERPATPTEPVQWQLHPPSENVAISHWPKIPNFVFSGDEALPTRALPDLDWREAQSMTLAELLDHSRGIARGVPLPREAPWPQQPQLPLDRAAPELPVPAQSIFEVQEGLRVALRPGPPPRHAEQTVAAHEASSTETGKSRHASRGKPHAGHARQIAGRGTRHAAQAHRGALKHLVQVRKKGSV
jgi:peptidoglycan-N-acetylglucosamine deacetylase